MPLSFPVLLGSLIGCCVAGGFLLCINQGTPAVPASASSVAASSPAGRSSARPKAPSTIPLSENSAPSEDRFLLSIDAALAENALEKRIANLRAALAIWAAQDPAAALRWARAQNQPWRTDAIDAVLAAAASQPDIALSLIRRLFAEEPGLLPSCGGNFLSALVAARQFPAAASLATEAPADLQNDWTILTFRRWGALQPREALASLPPPSAGELRSVAFNALVDGWSSARPDESAAYAVGLPAGPTRDHAMHTALLAWSVQDPAALSIWLGRFPPSPELDPAAAALVLQADRVNRTPEVALDWAATITDSQLRLKAIAHALRELARQDAPAAQRYITQSPLFSAEQREEMRLSVTAQ